MGTDIITPAVISRQLQELGRELDFLVKQLKEADVDAINKRSAADTAESMAFLEAEGSVESRKHTASLAASTKEHEAQIAEALVRHLRRSLSAVETRIEIGRSLGAAVRAEMAALPYQEG
jgi:hypothetical protein